MRTLQQSMKECSVYLKDANAKLGVEQNAAAVDTKVGNVLSDASALTVLTMRHLVPEALLPPVMMTPYWKSQWMSI